MNEAHIDRRRTRRARKVHKVAPVTRAIRAALAASAAMLALSGTALAQDACANATTRSVSSCTNDFAQVRADATLSIQPVDLTRVVDAALPTAVATSTFGTTDAGNIATITNSLVIGSYAGGDPSADLTHLDIVGAVSADEAMLGADAHAIGAFANGGDGIALLINGGDISARASSDTGLALAVGGFAYANIATAINDTTIVADALADTGGAVAIGLQAYGVNAATYNTGDISATASATGAGGTAAAYGLYTVGVQSAVSNNEGDIDVLATGDKRAVAVGIYNTAGLYGSVIDNSGTVSSHAISNGAYGAALAAGVMGQSMQGLDAIDIETTGTISVTAQSHGDYGTAVAYGALAASNGGPIDVHNGGSIQAVASADSNGPNLVNAFGAYVRTYGGAISIVNDGDILASGTSASHSYGTVYSMGVYSFGGAVYGAVADVVNNGGIHVDATTYDGKALATGIHQIGALSSVTTGADSSIEVTADSQFSGVSGATGIFNVGLEDSTVVNDGDIDATSHAAGSFYYSYAGSRAQGIYAGSTPFNNASVTNTGDINAVAVSENASRHFGGSSGATGIMAYGRIVDVQNEGDILASAHTNAGVAGVYGMIAHGKYSSEITNAGDITAYAYAGSIENDPQGFAGRAVALGTQIFGSRYATQTNTGDISATAIAADPFGNVNPALADAYAISIASTRTAALTTSGDITAYARADRGYANAYGVTMKSRQSSIVTNDGHISAHANADGGGIAFAVGVYERAVMDETTGAATLLNTGDIAARADADDGLAQAYGAVLIGVASTYAINGGTIVSHAEGAATVADGLLANSFAGSTYVQNTGVVGASAISTAGAAKVDGIVAIGTTVTTLITDGDVDAHANATGGDATAYGAYVKGGMAGGLGLLINGGDIDASATADGGLAYAVGAVVYADVATVINDHHVAATAHAIEGDALALGLQTYSFNGAAYNYGDVAAIAISDNGDAGAQGMRAYGYFSAIAENAGDITVGVRATADAAGTGMYSMAIFSGAYATNTGTVTVDVEGEDATANGILNADLYVGNATITNDGDVDVHAHGFSKAFAIGAYDFAYIYDATLINNGDIVATARAEGNPDAVQRVDVIGAQAVNIYGQGWGDAGIVNDGSIASVGWVEYGTGTAWASIVLAGPEATASLENNETLYANMHADKGVAGAYGVLANTYGKADVANHGDIVALSSVADVAHGLAFVQYADATGIDATGHMIGAYVANDGTIHAQATLGGGIATATGVFENGEVASLTNTGDINAFATTESWGGAFAYGANLHGVHDVTAVNDGTINVRGDAHDDTSGHYGASRATGIYAEASTYGDISLTNNGDINAVATAANGQSWFAAGAMAKGIDTYGKYDVEVVNNGDIHAIAMSEGGAVAAYGIVGDSKYYGHVVNAAGGVISAISSNATIDGDDKGGIAYAIGVEMMNSDVALVENDGAIVAHATVDAHPVDEPGGAGAWGVHNVFATQSGNVVNHGDIQAVARADYDYAKAYGISVSAGYHADTTNIGSIFAAAQSDQGDAWAVGSYAFAYHRTYNGCDDTGCHYTVDGGEAAIDNQGQITAQALADGGVAHAYGAVAVAVLDAGITNSGHITAIAQGDAATAAGVVTNSLTGATQAVNSGTIAASATGTTSADAKGVALHGITSIDIDNSGDILAGAYGTGTTATGVWLESAGANVVTNSGTIAAFGDGARVAIAANADSTTTIVNTGTLVGAITVGDLADSLDNAGTWRTVGASTFGDGDDTITNTGTLALQDATIDLGGYTAGNAFANTGTMFASGLNTVAMGGAFAAHNDGTISFLDGAADDVLTIDGDFSGQGTLLLDVSGRHNASDMLYVTGSVIEPTTQTLDITVLDLPNAPFVRLPLVYVDGASSAGQFVLGNVRTRQNDFTTLDVTLNSQIDTANGARDQFYLGVDVTGLNDQGAIATALSPGVARLMDAQIGTFRQRMGVVPTSSGKVGLAPFVRGFADSGDVDPDHVQNFGTGGDYGFSQSNQGWEVGLDSRPGDNVAFGLLVSKSKGNQRLGNGIGRTDLTGTGFGLYLTYLGNDGAYIDGSMRWTGVEARLRSGTAFQKTEGSAQTMNVEAGLNPWIVGGIAMQPQAQYTYTRIADFNGMQGGSAEFVEQGGDSQRARLGLLFSKDIATNGFLLQPYGSVNAVHEFNGEYGYSINNGALFGSTSLGGTSAMVELGLGARKGQWSLTGGLNWTDGGAVDGLFGGQVIARYSW